MLLATEKKGMAVNKVAWEFVYEERHQLRKG